MVTKSKFQYSLSLPVMCPEYGTVGMNGLNRKVRLELAIELVVRYCRLASSEP